MNITQKIKQIFIAGILALLPIVVTVYLLYFLYNIVVSKASPIVKKIAYKYNYDFSEYILQIGTFMLIILIIFIIGIFTRMYLGKLFIKMLDNIMTHIPIARSIYNATKQVIDSFGNTSGSSFSKVVLVEFPRRDMWMIAFLVRDSLPFMQKVSTKEESVNIFVPTAPNPTSGFVAIVPKKDIREIDISVEEGIKFVLSVGIINLDKNSDIKDLVKDDK